MRRATAQCLRRQWQPIRNTRTLLGASQPISCSTARMAGSLGQVNPPIASTDPTSSFQLLSTAEKAGQAEDAVFDEQVQQVQNWWASPRYRGIKRPYSAEDVVSKRGTLQQTYPSSLMARKLFNLFEERAAQGLPVHTSASTTSHFVIATFPLPVL